jgi:hypothetical protein
VNENYNINYFNTKDMPETPALVSPPQKVEGTDEYFLSSKD